MFDGYEFLCIILVWYILGKNPYGRQKKTILWYIRRDTWHNNILTKSTDVPSKNVKLDPCGTLYFSGNTNFCWRYTLRIPKLLLEKMCSYRPWQPCLTIRLMPLSGPDDDPANTCRKAPKWREASLVIKMEGSKTFFYKWIPLDVSF